ncbi:hypothetical protein L9F63_001117, partial [Diploptera punctata]
VLRAKNFVLSLICLKKSRSTILKFYRYGIGRCDSQLVGKLLPCGRLTKLTFYSHNPCLSWSERLTTVRGFLSSISGYQPIVG